MDIWRRSVFGLISKMAALNSSYLVKTNYVLIFWHKLESFGKYGKINSKFIQRVEKPTKICDSEVSLHPYTFFVRISSDTNTF